MGFKENFKNFFAPVEDDYEEESQQESYGEQPRRAEKESKDYDLNSARSSARESRSERTASSNGKVVNFGGSQLQVVLVKPERFEDAPAIADHLNARRTVVLNLENTPKEIVRRLIDFLSGVAYANKGQIKRAANSTFVITPENVDVSGDVFFDEHSGSGYYN